MASIPQKKAKNMEVGKQRNMPSYKIIIVVIYVQLESKCLRMNKA